MDITEFLEPLRMKDGSRDLKLDVRPAIDGVGVLALALIFSALLLLLCAVDDDPSTTGARVEGYSTAEPIGFATLVGL